MRYTPFGDGLVTIAKNVDFRIQLWSFYNESLIATDTLDGHGDEIQNFDYRITPEYGYQLITWGKDQKLQLWTFDKDVQENCGHKFEEEEEEEEEDFVKEWKKIAQSVKYVSIIEGSEERNSCKFKIEVKNIVILLKVTTMVGSRQFEFLDGTTEIQDLLLEVKKVWKKIEILTTKRI